MSDRARREAAHALLDAVVAYDEREGDTDTNERAVQLALDRLGLTPRTRVEAAPVLGAALDLLVATVASLAQDRDAAPEAVVRVLREHMDENIYTD